MKEQLKKILFNEQEMKNTETVTYALLDASGSDEVYYKNLFYDKKFKPLFDEEDLEMVSPYLVELKKNDEITDWILNSYNGANWISFIQSTKPYYDVLTTLKAFTKVYDTKEEEYVYIRYYDPRNIEITLDMFGKDGCELWFETIERMYARDTLTEGTLLKFTLESKEYILLKEEKI